MSCLYRLWFLLLAMAIILGAQSVDALAIRPLNGEGGMQTYSFVYRHSQGTESLGVVNGLIHSSLHGANACYFAYDVPSETLYLVKDDGSDLIQPGLQLSSTIPNANVANSQCIIYREDSSAVVRDPIIYQRPSGPPETGGKELVLTLKIKFQSAFAGDRAVFLAARNVGESLNSGWKARGTWNVAGADNSFPKVRMLSGANSAGPFVAEIYGSGLNPSLNWRLSLLINDAANGNNACWMVFANDVSNGVDGLFYLGSDTPQTTGFASFAFPSSGAPLDNNNQCTLAPSGSSVVRSSNKITITFNGALKPGFAASAKTVWAAAYGITGNPSSGWRPVAVTTQPSPNVLIAFPSIAGSSKLEANLGPIPIDYYNSQQLNCRQPGLCEGDVAQRFVASCPHTSSVRACYQAAFQAYANSGITGLRFQFAVCGSGGSKAFASCVPGQVFFNPSSAWATNFKSFYSDLYGAGIRRITPTPAMPGWDDDEGVTTTTQPNECTETPVQLKWFPMSPFPFNAEGIPYESPAGTFAYNCAPRNTTNFVGWDKLFDVYRFVI
jgi:hypothetical protein